MLPYLFPELAAFPTVADLITHLRTSDTRYRAALSAEFCAKNTPTMYITLYYIVTRLPDSLRVVRDHFLSVCPTILIVDLLKKALLEAEESIVAVGASRGDPRTPIFEGRSVRRLPLAGDVALARARGARALEGLAGAVVEAVEAAEGVGVAVGVVAGVEVSVAAVEVEAAAAAAVRAEVAEVEAVEEAVAEEVEVVGVALRRGPAPVVVSASSSSALVTPPTPHQLREWYAARQRGASEAAALGASASASSGAGESALSGTAPASASLTFTHDSGASRSFFRDRTTLAPLSRPVAVSLADPSGGLVPSHFSTVLPCPAAPSGTLSGLYLPSFSTNLVSGADLQDAGVHQFTPASHRVTHCTDARSGRHLATFTRRPGSSLYNLTTESPPVTTSGQVAVSGQVFAAASRSGPGSALCSCHLLSHETLLWHHRLGHPSLLRLRGMASCVLVSGLPRSLPPLPPGPGPTCVPCVEGRQRAAPHSSLFPPTEAPLQTLHMDVWGPARVRGQGHERYFLLVVDDYSRYTTVFPLRSKGDVTEVLIDWIRAARLQLRRSFGSDFPVLRLHSDRGGEFSSGLLRAYCRARGIRQTFTLPDPPQQNGIAERRISMVMDVARTSMMHAAAPHFLWPFAVRYAAHQINLHPRVSMPETSPALLWTGKVGDASAFRVWGSRAFVRDLSADKLSPRAVPCVFLGFPPDAPILPPYLSPCSVLPGRHVEAVEPVEVTGDSGGAEPGGADSGGAEHVGATPGGAEPWGATPGGAEPGGVEPGGATSGAAEPGGAEPAGAGPARVASGGAGPVGSPGASSGRELLYPQELREWFARRWRRAAGAGTSSAAEGGGTAGPRGARTGSTGAAGPAGTTGDGAAEGVGTEATAVGPGGGPVGGATGAAGGTAAGGADRAASAAGGAGAILASDSLHATSPTVTRLLATVVTDPSFESIAVSALVAELVKFAARCRLDYAAIESASVFPPSVGGECALGTDVLEDRQEEFQCLAATSPHLVSVLLTSEGDPDALDIPTPRSYAEAVEGPYSSQWQATMDAEMASWKSTGTYVDAVPPAWGEHRQWHVDLQGEAAARFSTCLQGAMTTLRVLLHIAAQRDYELQSLDFSTAFLQGSLHEEIWLRRPPGFTGTFPPGT
ncbi:unnamed protein product [Closterium sp. NIES-65]|nr:unnamed protein product [Closterium sp. NIES-65]